MPGNSKEDSYQSKIEKLLSPKRLIHPQSRICPPVLALLLSFVLPGLGQLLVGQIAKGIAVIAGKVILDSVASGLMVSLIDKNADQFLLVILTVIPYVYDSIASVDAYALASKLKRGKPIRLWQCF